MQFYREPFHTVAFYGSNQRKYVFESIPLAKSCTQFQQRSWVNQLLPNTFKSLLSSPWVPASITHIRRGRSSYRESIVRLIEHLIHMKVWTTLAFCTQRERGGERESTSCAPCRCLALVIRTPYCVQRHSDDPLPRGS